MTPQTITSTMTIKLSKIVIFPKVCTICQLCPCTIMGHGIPPQILNQKYNQLFIKFKYLRNLGILIIHLAIVNLQQQRMLHLELITIFLLYYSTDSISIKKPLLSISYMTMIRILIHQTRKILPKKRKFNVLEPSRMTQQSSLLLQYMTIHQ